MIDRYTDSIGVVNVQLGRVLVDFIHDIVRRSTNQHNGSTLQRVQHIRDFIRELVLFLPTANNQGSFERLLIRFALSLKPESRKSKQ